MNKNPQHDIINPPGQINNSKELDSMAYKSHPKTLGDVIDNVLYSEKLNYKKKLSFDDWFKQYNEEFGLPPADVIARAAWNAAQENK